MMRCGAEMSELWTYDADWSASPLVSARYLIACPACSHIDDSLAIRISRMYDAELESYASVADVLLRAREAGYCGCPNGGYCGCADPGTCGCQDGGRCGVHDLYVDDEDDVYAMRYAAYALAAGGVEDYDGRVAAEAERYALAGEQVFRPLEGRLQT